MAAKYILALLACVFLVAGAVSSAGARAVPGPHVAAARRNFRRRQHLAVPAALKNGYQRQRILAPHYLCLLERGTPVFDTSAPAWRRQRLLEQTT